MPRETGRGSQEKDARWLKATKSTPSQERPAAAAAAAAAEVPAKGRTTAREDWNTGVAGWQQARKVLSRAENHMKRRKKKRKTREPFFRNPYAFAEKLFTAAKSGRLDIPKDLVQSQKEHHSMTKSPHFLSHSFPTLHPTPTPPFPLPPSTTSIPIPSSAYRASRSTCSPQWHHPVAEAAGGARVWGTSGSRWNHLTNSSRWLTRVMSRQLLLHVVCIYIFRM